MSVERLRNFLDRLDVHWTVWAGAIGLVAAFAFGTSDGPASVGAWAVPCAVLLGLAGTFVLRSWAQRRALGSIGFDDWQHSVMPWGPQVTAGSLPADPSPFIRIALASPLTGAAAGIALFFAGWVLGGPASIGSAMLWWLGVASVLLSMIDALPAIPCSGRYLSWTVGWMRAGDSLGGRRFADWCGLAVSVAVAIGALVVLKGSPPVGIALGALAYLLGDAALVDMRETRAEARQRLLRRVMGRSGFVRPGAGGQPPDPRVNERLNQRGAPTGGPAGGATGPRSGGNAAPGPTADSRPDDSQRGANPSSPRRHVEIIDVEIIRE